MSAISSREFNQDVSAAKRAASQEPVVITDRGEPTHVLLSVEEFRRLCRDDHHLIDERPLVDLLRMDDDIEFDPEAVRLDMIIPDR